MRTSHVQRRCAEGTIQRGIEGFVYIFDIPCARLLIERDYVTVNVIVRNWLNATCEQSNYTVLFLLSWSQVTIHNRHTRSVFNAPFFLLDPPLVQPHIQTPMASKVTPFIHFHLAMAQAKRVEPR